MKPTTTATDQIEAKPPHQPESRRPEESGSDSMTIKVPVMSSKAEVQQQEDDQQRHRHHNLQTRGGPARRYSYCPLQTT